MVNFSQVARRGPHHSCIYGFPKTGKSTLVSKLAEMGKKLVWISLDNGHGILDKLSPEAKSRIELISVADTKSNPIAIKTALKLVKGGLYRVCDDHGRIDCDICKRAARAFTNIDLHKLDPNTIVVWDPISQIMTSAINAIIQRESKTEEGQDVYKLDYGDWASLGHMMDRFLSEIQQAPYHTICITHVLESDFEDSKKRLVPLSGTVNFSANSAKYFDSVIYMEVQLGGKHAAGSGTGFKLNTVTGSRNDIKIEDMKDGPSLLPFFPDVVVGDKLASSLVEQEDNQAAAAVLSAIAAVQETGYVAPAINQQLDTAATQITQKLLDEQQSGTETPKLSPMELLNRMKKG